MKDRVYIAVIDMPEIVSRATFDRKYEGSQNSRQLPVTSVCLVPKEILAGDIEKVFVKRAGKNLESYQLFDIYEGAQIRGGYKSVAYSLVFRAKDRNLEEADISGAMDKILKALENMGIEA